MTLKLEDMTIDELVDRFADMSVAQDKALFDDEYRKFNRLYDQMDATEKELRSRGRDARLALLRLYDHPNMQVRLNAAKRTLGIAPDAARRAIEAISKSGCYPQAGDAGMCLVNLDRGIFRPD